MADPLSEQQQLALFDALLEVRINLQAAKDKLIAEPNAQELADERNLRQKVANLENALILLEPLAKRVSG
ncbi:hypothetical protein ELH72_29720 (plasmid) [Rhizobium ruizarguesonis]|uniref:hypothetical protein n=1 Tax=Rhizobium ruizarguesonis TaxID=2081791 RepID=UPI0010308193|nr:hypothetical protein [Rhizobium ruizarguesonis]TAZ71105.1 hypothetical protein ELH72_29720 [Rhizobium ruizarguesonis]